MHIMIDIETWDTVPTAVVRAIAMVAFEENGAIFGKRLIDARETVDVQLEEGRTVDPVTVAWWQRQTPLGRQMERYLETSLSCARSIRQIFDEIDEFVKCAAMSDHEKIWSRGHFDMPIIRDLFKTLEYDRDPIDDAVLISEPLWLYYAEADVRTLDVLTGRVQAQHPHDPLSDAEAQVRQVVNALALRQIRREPSHDQAA